MCKRAKARNASHRQMQSCCQRCFESISGARSIQSLECTSCPHGFLPVCSMGRNMTCWWHPCTSIGWDGKKRGRKGPQDKLIPKGATLLQCTKMAGGNWSEQRLWTHSVGSCAIASSSKSEDDPEAPAKETSKSPLTLNDLGTNERLTPAAGAPLRVVVAKM